jgi:hypothetical protein
VPLRLRALSTGYSIVSRDVYGSFAGNITVAGLYSDNINVKGITIGSKEDPVT